VDSERRDINRLQYNYETAAKWLGITERQLRRMVSRREITNVKVGRSVRFRQCDLDEYTERSIRPPAIKSQGLLLPLGVPPG
jgi:excisionase family DNA binding protein